MHWTKQALSWSLLVCGFHGRAGGMLDGGTTVIDELFIGWSVETMGQTNVMLPLTCGGMGLATSKCTTWDGEPRA